MLLFREYGILKEGSRASAILISWNDEHALQGANVAHGLARFGEIGRSLAPLEVPLEVGIGDTRLAIGREGIGDTENDEASAFAGVEDAGSIAEGTGLGTQVADLAVLAVEHQH